MNDYQLLEVQYEKHKDLIREAKQARAARDVQSNKEPVKKNALVQLLTTMTRG